MVVKDVLRLVAIFLNKKELLEDEVFLTAVPDYYTPNQQRQDQIEQLLLCLNLVCNELARDYLPLLTQEQIEFQNGKFEYTKLSKVLLDVFGLTTLSGKSVKYKTFPTFIQAPVDKAIIQYSYEPQELGIEDKIENFFPSVPMRVLAYGVAMEFCFLNSLSTEALIWESRYKDALLLIKRKKSEIRMPARRWV